MLLGSSTFLCHPSGYCPCHSIVPSDDFCGNHCPTERISKSLFLRSVTLQIASILVVGVATPTHSHRRHPHSVGVPLENVIQL